MSTSINIYVSDSSRNEEVIFQLPLTKPLKRMMEAYCARQSLSLNSTMFSIGNYIIDPNDTCLSLGIKENDRISVIH